MHIFEDNYFSLLPYEKRTVTFRPSYEAENDFKKLQDYITENYYQCTNGIPAGLGQMYVEDERFRNNTDKHADGTAAFICEAIEIYSGK